MIAFGTVVYDKAVPLLDEFIESINKQSYSNFDLLVINDNVQEDIFNNYLSKAKYKCVVINENGNNKTPVELRVELLKEAKTRGYELLVIGDCDDIFDINRVKVIYERFLENKEYAFYYNDILLFDRTPLMSDIPPETIRIDSILQHNYLGMSNASINMNFLTFDFIDSLHECDSFVFDWYLFSRIVCGGGKGLFVKKAVTFYRIYDNNYAGICSSVQLKKEIEVKTKQYRLMTKYNNVYAFLLEKISNIDAEHVNPSQSESSFWWDNIKL